MTPRIESTHRILSRRQRHLELLIALVSMQIFHSLLSPEMAFQRAILNALFLIVVLSAIRTLSTSPMRMWLAIVLGGFAYLMSWFGEIYPSTLVVGMIHVSFVSICALLISALVESVFAEGPIDSNRIIGAVSIYFLLGLAWAFIYALIELTIPGSFDLRSETSADGQHSAFLREFIYYSNVTLTTLGYGDIVPLSRPARLFTTLEAMAGQLYVAIVIARLVGLQISQVRE